jgi:hypothetical protein
MYTPFRDYELGYYSIICGQDGVQDREFAANLSIGPMVTNALSSTVYLRYLIAPTRPIKYTEVAPTENLYAELGLCLSFIANGQYSKH